MVFLDLWSGYKSKKLNDLILDKMSEALDAEEKLSETLPRLAQAVANPFLRFNLEEQSQQSKNQVGRLRQAFGLIGEAPRTKYSFITRDLINEGEGLIMIEDPTVRDVALVSEIKNLKENEIMTYETICDWAKGSGRIELAEIFKQSLSEEEGALGKLDDLSKVLYKNISRQA